MSATGSEGRWERRAAWFLAVSYGLGAPLTAYIEWDGGTFSERFDLSPALIYITCAVQVACAMGVLTRSMASWAAGVLTVITLGAIGAHLSIGSPETAVAAVVYSAIQVWFGLRSRRSARAA